MSVGMFWPGADTSILYIMICPTMPMIKVNEWNECRLMILILWLIISSWFKKKEANECLIRKINGVNNGAKSIWQISNWNRAEVLYSWVCVVVVVNFLCLFFYLTANSICISDFFFLLRSVLDLKSSGWFDRLGELHRVSSELSTRITETS